MSIVRMNARFPGRCNCGRSVWRNQSIEFDRSARRIVGCFDCSHETPAADPDAKYGRRQDGTPIEAADLFI